MIDAIAARLRPRSRRGGRSRARRAIAARRPSRRFVVKLVVALALLGGAWLWLRDSSLVAVNRVTVLDASGPEASQIRSALVVAARNMTTLDVQIGQLRSAVAPFPGVKDLQVSTQFPHGMRIRVIEQIPVGAVVVAGRRIAVAGDGTLLHDVAAPQSLAAIPLSVTPGGTRLTDRNALGAVAILAAAPYQLMERVTQVSSVASHGLVAQLRNGPSIYFGDASDLGAKWTAVADVLADPGSVGAVYVDVTDPERPAAGGVGPPQTTTVTDPTAAATSASSAASGTSASAADPGTSTDTTPASTTPTSSTGG